MGNRGTSYSCRARCHIRLYCVSAWSCVFQAHQWGTGNHLTPVKQECHIRLYCVRACVFPVPLQEAGHPCRARSTSLYLNMCVNASPCSGEQNNFVGHCIVSDFTLIAHVYNILCRAGCPDTHTHTPQNILHAPALNVLGVVGSMFDATSFLILMPVCTNKNACMSVCPQGTVYFGCWMRSLKGLAKARPSVGAWWRRRGNERDAATMLDCWHQRADELGSWSPPPAGHFSCTRNPLAHPAHWPL